MDRLNEQLLPSFAEEAIQQNRRGTGTPLDYCNTCSPHVTDVLFTKA